MQHERNFPAKTVKRIRGHGLGAKRRGATGTGTRSGPGGAREKHALIGAQTRKQPGHKTPQGRLSAADAINDIMQLVAGCRVNSHSALVSQDAAGAPGLHCAPKALDPGISRTKVVDRISHGIEPAHGAWTLPKSPAEIMGGTWNGCGLNQKTSGVQINRSGKSWIRQPSDRAQTCRPHPLKTDNRRGMRQPHEHPLRGRTLARRMHALALYVRALPAHVCHGHAGAMHCPDHRTEHGGVLR